MTIDKLESFQSLRKTAIQSPILDNCLCPKALDIMTEQSKSRKLPAGARDITQSVTQLTSDADTLHDVAIELLESYTGEDKNGKLTKIRGSYQSMLGNINVVCGGYLSTVPPISPLVGDLQREDEKTRRHSIVDRIRHVWKGRDQEPVNLSEGGSSVVVRRNKNRSRANTSSPAAGLRPSPRSSTESLNKVNCNRHSGCSHYSTDSDTADCMVERVTKRPLASAVSQATPRSSHKQPSNRRDQAKSTAFDNLFRLRGQPAAGDVVFNFTFLIRINNYSSYLKFES
eukprot:sb/3467763/